MIVVGAVVGWIYDRKANRTARPAAAIQLGVLLASGLIVGDGIIQVVIALIKSFSPKAAPLALVGPEGLLAKSIPDFETAGIIIGGVAFVGVTFLLYRWILGVASKRSA